MSKLKFYLKTQPSDWDLKSPHLKTATLDLSTLSVTCARLDNELRNRQPYSHGNTVIVLGRDFLEAHLECDDKESVLPHVQTEIGSAFGAKVVLSAAIPTGFAFYLSKDGEYAAVRIADDEDNDSAAKEF